MKVIKPYRTYTFRGKDPIINRVRAEMETCGAKVSGVQKASGVSSSTIHGWFTGPTRRPQYATLVAVARSIGCDITFARVSTTGPALMQPNKLHKKKQRTARPAKPELVLTV